MKMFNEQKTDLEAEQFVLGVTHAEIGGWIAEKWRLPVSYIEVVKYHHTPSLAQLNKSLVAVTQVSNLISKQNDPAAQRYQQETESIVDSEAWRILKLENPSVQHVNLEQILSEITLAADATKIMMSQMTGGK
jgi:HD-like signal output (HDOD) protein